MKQTITLLATALLASTCLASDYPSRPITLVIAFPPGGGADAVARPIADALGKELGQPVVIDNRPGAGMTMASRHVAKSAPDGYTLYMTSASHYGADKVLYKNLPYDGKSFTPIAKWTTTPLVLTVSHQSGIQSVSDLIARAKAQPGKLTYASSGNGASSHLAGVMFNEMAGTKLIHVPYKGTGPALNDLLAGQVDMTFTDILTAMPYIQSGKVKALGMATAKRSSAMPDIPTIAEQGLKGYDVSVFFGVVAPKSTPPDRIKVLNQAFVQALATDKVRQSFAKQGLETAPDHSPAYLGQFIRQEVDAWAKVVKQSGVQLD